jgi:iron complex transport system substrate-binding protein
LALLACQSPTAAPTSTPVATAAAPPAYPLSLVDDDGTTVVIDAAPERVVSLSPAITETVFALGAGDRLVGGTDFDDYPPEAAAVPDVVANVRVLLEQIVELEPDLVLAAGNNFTPAADISRLRELGLPVLVTYADSMEGALHDIRLIGSALGADAEAERIVGGMEARVTEVSGAVEEIDDRPRVFYELGAEPQLYGPAPDSFVADLIALAGGEPITTNDPAVFTISLERLVSLDPEVIVLGDANYGTCPGDVTGRPGWGSMTAVLEGAIVPVDDIIVTRPGPRLGEGLAALTLAIHPEAGIESPVGAAVLCAASETGG